MQHFIKIFCQTDDCKHREMFYLRPIVCTNENDLIVIPSGLLAVVRSTSSFIILVPKFLPKYEF